MFNRDVLVETTTTDRYGRTVGRVYVEGRDVNAALVTAGAAWVYRQYSRDPRLLALEAGAKTASRGLWGLPEAQRTPPWEWRRAQRKGETQAAPAGFSCDGKSTCGLLLLEPVGIGQKGGTRGWVDALPGSCRSMEVTHAETPESPTLKIRYLPLPVANQPFAPSPTNCPQPPLLSPINPC